MKYFLSSIIGLITCVVCISLFEYLGMYLFPLPDGIDFQDMESIKANMDTIPFINLIMIIVSYALASFIAGFVSIKIKSPKPLIPIMVIGIVLTLFGFVNFFKIPHPLWMIIVGSITFFPMTWLGGKAGSPKISFDSVYKF